MAGDPLKSETSNTPIPVPSEPTLALSATVAAGEGTILTYEIGRPPLAGAWIIERKLRAVRTAHADPLPHEHSKSCAGA